MLIPKYVKYKCISSHCLFVAILFIVLGACDNKREIKTQKKFVDKCELKQVDSLLFELDSSTPYGTQSIQLVSHKDSSYLAYLNEQNATIYLYNLKSPKNPKTISFLTEKYNFTKIHGLHIHSLDSIFILNGYRLFLSDMGGNIIKTYSLIDKSIYQTSSNPTMGTLAPAKLIGNTLYISAMPDKDFFNSNYFEGNELKILLNIKTGQFKYTFSYPNSYKNEVWGNNLAYFFHTYNEDKNVFVYSFSIDENIYSTNHSNLLNTFYAGSKFFTGSKPMEGIITKDFQKRFEYYLRQPSYFAIYYDKYRKLYYRIAHQPTPEEDIINQNYIKHTSIIILDNNFTKIGETLLPKYGYTETMCFITKEGLYIAKPNKENENILSFGLFKIFDKHE